MQKRALSFLPLALCTALACNDASTPTTGPAAPDRPRAISNGTPTGTSYGSVGALFIDINGDNRIDGACTGGLIAPTVFLTAAHCLELGPNVVYYVSFEPDVSRFWRTDITPLLGDLILAEATYMHPDYAFPYADIGVVILPENSTEDIPLLTLPTLGYLDEVLAQGELGQSSVVVAGYGVAALGGWETSRYDGIRKVGASKLLSLQSDVLYYAKNRLNAGGTSTCSGDSGAPVFLEGGDPSLVIAVHSFGNDPGCHSVGGGTRLDTELARDFLGEFVTLP